jgi:hypothetical protein
MDGATAARGPCVFARALFAGTAGCALARRESRAEREAFVCASPVARQNCSTLFGLLRERSAFVLRLADREGPLPHAAAMRLACGGLEGLARAIGEPATDVHALVGAARARYGSLEALPWSAIVPAVGAWVPRRRHGGSTAP